MTNPLTNADAERGAITDAAQAFSQAYYLIKGEPAPWSDSFGYDEALEDIKDACATLRVALREKTGEADRQRHIVDALKPATRIREAQGGERGEVTDEGHPHLIGGEFQSDKYPTCPRGKVPLSVKDKSAQDLLWEYAQRRRAVDAEFAADLEIALKSKGFVP